ncbi:MAG: TIGR00730 family Rossman fold protein [Myxococcales bacterium]
MLSRIEGMEEERSMRRVGVFCGSSNGASPVFREAGRALGSLLARQGLAVVYGGGRVGVMGAVAEGALAERGRVYGVIPEVLEIKERAHPGLTELRLVKTMHERKALMAELSDAFVALPGGMGTLDEFCEIVTWAQLGLHQKPCGLLDVGGYFRSFVAFIDTAVAQGFVKAEHRSFIQVASDPEELVAKLRAFKPTLEEPRWIGPEQT